MEGSGYRNDSNNQVKPSMILFVNYLVRHSLSEYIIEKNRGEKFIAETVILVENSWITRAN